MNARYQQSARRGGRGNKILSDAKAEEFMELHDNGATLREIEAREDCPVSFASLSLRFKRMRESLKVDSDVNVEALLARISHLEEENERLENDLESYRNTHQGSRGSPARDAIIEALGELGVASYLEIAAKIGVPPHRVRNLINQFPDGLIVKLTDEKGKVWVRLG